jgi:hypothetical protein
MPLDPEIYDNDHLVISLDLYEREVQRRLNEAHWNDNTDEVELLQQRMRSVNMLREFGEEYWTRF